MAAPIVTNVDFESINSGARETTEQLLTVGGAVSYPEGTLLAMSTSTFKLVPYVKGGSTAGNGVASHVLVGGATSTGSGDIPVTALKRGSVRFSHLSIVADGDNSNIDGAVKLQLEQAGFDIDVDTETSELDNQ